MLTLLQPIHTSTIAWFGMARLDKKCNVNVFVLCPIEPSQSARYNQAGTAQHGLYVDSASKSFKQKMAAFNWTSEEVFKLISIWSNATIQKQLEGCHRNSYSMFALRVQSAFIE